MATQNLQIHRMAVTDGRTGRKDWDLQGQDVGPHC